MCYLILKRYLDKIILFIIFSFSILLMGCGGAGTSGVANFSTMAVFNDNYGSGVVLGEYTNGVEIIAILPEAVASAEEMNSNPTPDGILSDDISSYPIVSQSNGYNIRQGSAYDSGQFANFLKACKIF